MAQGHGGLRLKWAAAAILFAVVFGASLFGILTRTSGFLAAFWPANALLLGLLVRFPRLDTVGGWIGALLGYLAADLLAGGDLVKTVWLTVANLSGVAVGVTLFGMLNEEDRRLRRPLSVLFLFGISMGVGAAAAVIGAPGVPAFFGKDLYVGAAFWFATETTNAIILLPVILTAPWPPRLLRLRRLDDLRALGQRAAPVAALVVSLILGALIGDPGAASGGPGALAFPAPALLWCALSYSLFGTAVLTMLVSIWQLLSMTYGPLGPENAPLDNAAAVDRLAIMLLALGPLTAASINAARNDLLKRLEAIATYDSLTGALARAAFLERANQHFVDPARAASVAVLMLDIDRFKRINDTYGHAAGDVALAAVAGTIGSALREGDLFGRMGGEEFAIVLPRAAADSAMVAERLRAAVAAMAIPIDGTASLTLTVSIGVARPARTAPAELDRLLGAADRALYQAKNTGRDRVVCVEG
ncbi:GGDEF domain-containing protein [Xanthobacter tagetidis]|nr:GGDEF domain-containing protein [Xanthobacter tagetidis]MBB6306497.1 diguanylate cyclase (GGDEF)-like protein [Xanthobacter tagetidis]